MKYCLFDTETTDLMPNSVIALKHRPHVIEFYGMVLEHDEETNGWAKIDELEFLCKPPVPISDEITRITGIKPEDVKGKADFHTHAKSVRDLIEACDGVVAHNLSYDMAVLDTEFEREKDAIRWPGIHLCTVEATEHLKGFRLNLSALHEHLFGEPFSGAHRAREDVEAMGRCFVELWQRGEI